MLMSLKIRIRKLERNSFTQNSSYWRLLPSTKNSWLWLILTPRLRLDKLWVLNEVDQLEENVEGVSVGYWNSEMDRAHESLEQDQATNEYSVGNEVQSCRYERKNYESP